MKITKRLFFVLLIAFVYSMPLFSKETDKAYNLKEAAEYIKKGLYEQARSALIPCIKYSRDINIKSNASILMAITYYHEDNIKLSLCMLSNLMQETLTDEIRDDILSFLEIMAENLDNHKEEALAISLFIIRNDPGRKDAYFRAGYILYSLFDDKQSALFYFQQGLSLYPAKNLKALYFLKEYYE